MTTTRSTLSALVAPLAAAFAACASQTTTEAVVIRTTGAARNVTRLTMSAENEINPVVSPDGARVAFQVEKNGQFDIVAVSSQGTARTTVTEHPADDVQPAWSPDGKHLVFSSARLGRFCLWKQLATGGGGTTMITRGIDMIDFAPSVSPDGGTVCFTSRGVGSEPSVIKQSGAQAYTGFTQGLPYLWMVHVDGTNLTQFGQGVYPTWSPDGERIAFCSDVGGNWDIWLMGKDGSSLTQVTIEPRQQISPSFAPDGKWLSYVSDESGNYDLWIMKADGTARTQLTADDSEEATPAWGKDGNIYFSSNKTGNWDVWRLTPVLPE